MLSCYPTWFMRWGRVLWWGMTVLGLTMLAGALLLGCTSGPAPTGELSCPSSLPYGRPPNCSFAPALTDEDRDAMRLQRELEEAAQGVTPE